MNSRKMILTGFALTALATSLVLSDLLPSLVLASIVLLAGIAITYYAALNKKRLRQIRGKDILLQVISNMHGEMPFSQIVKQVKRGALRLVKSEGCVFISFENAELFDNEELPSWHGWKELNGQIKNEQKSLIFNRKDKDLSFKSLPREIESFIGLPVKKGQEIVGVLYLFNEKEKGFFDRHDKDVLEELILITSQELERLHIYEERESLCLSVINSIVRAVEFRTPVFAGHAERVTAVSKIIGRRLGLNEKEMRILEYSTMLHDIGQLAVEASNNESEGEERKMSLSSQHPLLGAEMLPSSGILKEVKEGILYHHERYDGSGFPEGLSRTEIPLISRIIAVADVYDALTMLSYEEAVEHYTAIREIKKAMGSFFDPLVVTALEEVGEEVKALMEEMTNEVYSPASTEA